MRWLEKHPRAFKNKAVFQRHQENRGWKNWFKRWVMYWCHMPGLQDTCKRRRKRKLEKEKNKWTGPTATAAGLLDSITHTHCQRAITINPFCIMYQQSAILPFYGTESRYVKVACVCMCMCLKNHAHFCMCRCIMSRWPLTWGWTLQIMSLSRSVQSNLLDFQAVICFWSMPLWPSVTILSQLWRNEANLIGDAKQLKWKQPIGKISPFSDRTWITWPVLLFALNHLIAQNTAGLLAVKSLT